MPPAAIVHSFSNRIFISINNIGWNTLSSEVASNLCSEFGMTRA